jgi:hypothetical protein
MANRIMGIEVADDLKDPTEPKVWVSVTSEHSDEVDVRGRLMGPRCRYASTVEVAYPLRPAPAPPSPGFGGEGTGVRGHLTFRRVVIPEASLWEPASPFLYSGPVELWQEDKLADQITLVHGLRYFSLGSRGLRINGRLLTLRGLMRNESSEAEMLRLRQEGYNLIVADVAIASEKLWADADTVGFVVLGRVAGDAAAIHTAVERRTHASNLGWLLDSRIFSDETLRSLASPLLKSQLSGQNFSALIGVEAGTGELPAETQFILGPPTGETQLPLLALTDQELPQTPGLLGTVRP